MPRNKCFAPGCTSGYLVNRKKCKKDGIKVCSLFKCRNNEFLEKWQKAIPRGDRIFTKDDALCELHFEVESICTYFETVLPDGSVHKIEREKPTLKKDAIPCIFPNLPTYLSSSVKKRKAPSIRKGLPCKKICSVASQPIIPPDSNVASDPIIAPDPNVASDPLITPVLHYVLTFEILSKNLNQIKTPNVWWSINVLPNSVICAKWTGDHNLERRVVVNENLKIKVFMLQTQCNTDIEHEVSTIDGLSSWLKQVEDYQMCVGINDRNINKSCLGVATLVKDGRKSNLCSECRKEKKKFQRRSKRANIERSKQFRGRLICSERKQLRLKKKTPDGTVNLKYWETVVAIDGQNTLALKASPLLTPDHINPKAYMKMNVAMAFQFFSRSVAAGMQHFKVEHPESCLKDSNGCVKFINRFNDLIDAMNSRCPKTALKPDSNAEKAIKDFLQFLDKWELFAIEKDANFISESTCFGLKVSLKATLEILTFLSSKCSYGYLMTTRLNQDSLERFFGMMRNACGSNDHPDAKVFLQLFRLIGTYSLVKPPKGSNISGSEMLRALVGEGGINDPVVQACGLRDMLDSVLDKGTDMHIFAESSNDPDHNYYILNSADYVVAYVAGYVARRSQRFTKCDTCKAYLLDNTITSPANVLIDLKSKGWLLKPSLGLFNLVKVMEECVMEVVARQPVSVHTLHEIVETLSFKINVSLVGCLEHQHDFSNSIMRFYLVTRMHFLCNRVNQVDAEKVKKTKELRKLSKLT